MDRVKVGVIGCGMISDIYLTNLTQKFCDIVEVIACADRHMENAIEKANQYGIRASSIDELLVDNNVELVLNLTKPATHAELSKKALQNGKHVYSEKPIAVELEDAKELLELAKEKQLCIGCAPDTFLGGGLQTVIKLLEDGVIGDPISCNALLLARGPEATHPNPEFFYKNGAGPVMDMGPYYVTAMIALFGPVKRVAGMAKATYRERTRGRVRAGETFPCEVDTHISGLLEFENRVIANLTTSWDMQYPYWESKLPLFEIFGTKGAIIVPDPNTFGGITPSPLHEVGTTVLVRKGAGEFEEYPIETGFTKNSRGLGLAEMAYAIRSKKEHHANGELALHVLETLKGILSSGKDNAFVTMQTTCTKPTAFYMDSCCHFAPNQI